MVTNTGLTTSRRRWHPINFTVALLLGVSVLALGGCPVAEQDSGTGTLAEPADRQVAGAAGSDTADETNNQDGTKEDSGMPIDVTNDDFQVEVLEADVPVLVDFWAPWCGPCQMMHPVLESLAETYDGRVVIARVNLDEDGNQELGQRYQIRAIPYMAIFKNGEIVEEIVGVRPEEELASALDKAIGD